MYQTGETCTTSGYYKFVGHTDGSTGCHPTPNEMDIPIHAGDKFPPIKPCGKSANWIYVSPL